MVLIVAPTCIQRSYRGTCPAMATSFAAAALARAFLSALFKLSLSSVRLLPGSHHFLICYIGHLGSGRNQGQQLDERVAPCCRQLTIRCQNFVWNIFTNGVVYGTGLDAAIPPKNGRT